MSKFQPIELLDLDPNASTPLESHPELHTVHFAIYPAPDGDWQQRFEGRFGPDDKDGEIRLSKPKVVDSSIVVTCKVSHLTLSDLIVRLKQAIKETNIEHLEQIKADKQRKEPLKETPDNAREVLERIREKFFGDANE